MNLFGHLLVDAGKHLVVHTGHHVLKHAVEHPSHIGVAHTSSIKPSISFFVDPQGIVTINEAYKIWKKLPPYK